MSRKNKKKKKSRSRGGLETHRFVSLVKDRLSVTGNDDLISPFERFIHLRSLGDVVLTPNHIDQIKHIALYADPVILRKHFIEHLFKPLGIPIPVKRRDTRSSRDRVSAYRARLKERGYRTVSFFVPLDEYKLFLELKEELGASSYRELFVSLARDRLLSV